MLRLASAFWFGTAWGVLTGAAWTDDRSAINCLVAIGLGIAFAGFAIAAHKSLGERGA